MIFWFKLLYLDARICIKELLIELLQLKLDEISLEIGRILKI
jgi:hypothetical protein